MSQPVFPSPLPRGSTKAFKGKGDLRQRINEVEQELSVIHRRMRQLCDETRTIRGRMFTLETHARKPRAAISLRWRFVQGQHANWARDIAPSLAMFPVELKAWYRQVHGASLILNTEERVLRFERVALEHLLAALAETRSSAS